jgi:hypothetical protein
MLFLKLFLGSFIFIFFIVIFIFNLLLIEMYANEFSAVILFLLGIPLILSSGVYLLVLIGGL